MFQKQAVGLLPRRSKFRGLQIALAVCGALVLAGCQGPTKRTPKPLPKPTESQANVPSYKELVQRYNANAKRVDRLWSTAVVAMRWVDEDGKKQFEQGEGHFIYVRPNEVALTVGKVGKVMMWAGAGNDRYWLFDLRDKGKAYVGDPDNVGKPCTQPIPLPVYPRAVPHLLGLMPLDESLADQAPPVERINGQYLIEPPGLNLRMVLDPDTALPVRVDLLNDRGESVVVGKLSEHEYVEMEGHARNTEPKVATRAVFYAVGEDAQLSLNLSNLTDGRRFDKINENAFKFDVLQKKYHPAEVVDLDRDCK